MCNFLVYVRYVCGTAANPYAFVQVKDICNELDVRSLCHKILQNVSTLLNADRGSLFLVQGERPVPQKATQSQICPVGCISIEGKVSLVHDPSNCQPYNIIGANPK